MYLLISLVIIAVIVYFIFINHAKTIIIENIEEYQYNQGLGYKALKSRETFLKSKEVQKVGDKDKIIFALTAIQRRRFSLNDIKKHGFILNGGKTYISLGHNSVEVSDMVKLLIEQIGVKETVFSSRLGNHTDLCVKILNDGTFLEPILVRHKDYDGQEDSSYIEQHFKVAIINEEKGWDYVIDQLKSPAPKEGQGKDWYYSSSIIQWNLTQIGDFLSVLWKHDDI